MFQIAFLMHHFKYFFQAFIQYYYFSSLSHHYFWLIKFQFSFHLNIIELFYFIEFLEGFFQFMKSAVFMVLFQCLNQNYYLNFLNFLDFFQCQN